jgi:23S rRNA (uridine2552-2'-O)-methyltransferase
MPKKSGGSRDLTVRVKTARGRKNSSTRWLQRQLNDPYVQQAKRDGYRSRAAYKMLELDEKFALFKSGQRILDLGAAPGGWSQVALQKIGKKGSVHGLDLLEIEPMAGAEFVVMDFMADDAPERLNAMMGGPADVVLSDMAANTTGHTSTDHIRIIALCELAYDFAVQVLNPGGAFVCKVLKGGTENDLLKMMKRDFETVKHAKPQASRKDSAESYVVAKGFRGKAASDD